MNQGLQRHMSPRTEGAVFSERTRIRQQSTRTDIVLELLPHPHWKRIQQRSVLRVLNVTSVERTGSSRASMPFLILNLRAQKGAQVRPSVTIRPPRPQ